MKVLCVLILLFPLFGSCENENMTGTVNVILASPAGYVAATDSRGSYSPDCVQHTDQSQKLFVVGDSAITIAGFGASLSGTGYDVDVGSAIRDRFNEKDMRSHGGFLAAFMKQWITDQLLPAIEAIDAIVELRRGAPRQGSAFFATLVEWDTRLRLPVIRKIQFVATNFGIGPTGSAYKKYSAIEEPPQTADSFKYETAGIDSLVRGILSGRERRVDDPVIHRYLTLRDSSHLEQFTLEDMRDLATKLVELTARITQCVGGPVQVAVSEKDKQTQVTAGALTQKPGEILGSYYAIGARFSQGSKPQEKLIVPNGGLLAVPEFAHLYIASAFSGVKIWLDGNFFIGDKFEDVTFAYSGQRFSWEKNQLSNCSIELTRGNYVPPVFGSCRVVKKVNRTPSQFAEYIGTPEKWIQYPPVQ